MAASAGSVLEQGIRVWGKSIGAWHAARVRNTDAGGSMHVVHCICPRSHSVGLATLSLMVDDASMCPSAFREQQGAR